MEERRALKEDAAAPPVEERSLLGQIRLWGGLAGVALLAVFLVQNLDDARVNFLWFDWDIPLIFALIASAILGALASMLFGFFRSRAREADIQARVALRREQERERKR
jgi:uncharacterized integral membrane protein